MSPDETMQFEVLADGYVLPEAARIDAQNRLYFSDAQRGGVFRRAPDGAIETLIPERRMVGGIGLNRNGGLVVSGKTLSHWNAQTGEIRDLFADWSGLPLHHVNDLAVDAQGSVWTGNFNWDPTSFNPFKNTPPPGGLFRVDPSGAVTQLWEGIEVSNGMGFSADGKLLYHCDSSTKAVWVYEVRGDRTVAPRQRFASVPEGVPDGLAVDAEGGVWVAIAYGTGEIVRFKPDGTLDRRVRTPGRVTVSVQFGGPDLCDLYVMSANTRERTGTIFRARSDIPGLAVHEAQF